MALQIEGHFHSFSTSRLISLQSFVGLLPFVTFSSFSERTFLCLGVEEGPISLCYIIPRPLE